MIGSGAVLIASVSDDLLVVLYKTANGGQTWTEVFLAISHD